MDVPFHCVTLCCHMTLKPVCILYGAAHIGTFLTLVLPEMI